MWMYVICVMLKLEPGSPGSQQDLEGQVAQVLVENCCLSYLSLRPSLQFPHRHYRKFHSSLSGRDSVWSQELLRKDATEIQKLGDWRPWFWEMPNFFLGVWCKFGFFLYYRVDGQNIQTYSNPATRTMLKPRAPKSQCFSAHVTKNDKLGVWFLSSIGANALQVSSGYINIELWGRGGCTG